MRIALFMLLVACEVKVTTPTNVDVRCETNAKGVDCVLKHVAGSTETEACWDLVMTCANGAVVTARHMCAKVAVGGTANAVMPIEKVDNIAACGGDKPPTAKVDNLTIDGKTPDLVTPHKN